jgi:hypothetical protein
MAALKKYGIEATLKDQFEECLMGGSKAVIAIAPEILGGFPSFRDHLGKLGEIEFTSVWSLSYHPGDLETINHALPLTGFAEKIGTYTNYAGKMRVLDDPFPSAVSSAKDVAQWVEEISRALAY